jgi:hypothetical protein
VASSQAADLTSVGTLDIERSGSMAQVCI